ncbi:MAG: hypothetical protein ABJF23_01185 [Bryobacteraceae bacterium]
MMNERLKTAVHSVTAPPHLAARIRSEIDATSSRSVWGARLMAVAATVALCIGATVAYQLGHLRLTTASQESYISSVSNQVATIMRVGLRDHIHCAVFRKYPKAPPKVEDLAQEMGTKYAGLMQIVQSRVPSGYQLMMAHQCRYHGRRFVHLALTKDGQVLSVVVAVKGEGESFQTENLVPALAEAGIPLYRSGVQRFQIAAFESKEHLVYVISDLPQQKNMDLLLALAPDVKAFLSRLES